MGAPVRGRGHDVSQRTPSDLMEQRKQSVSLFAWRAAVVAAAVARTTGRLFIGKLSPPDGFVFEFIKVGALLNQRIEVSRPGVRRR